MARKNLCISSLTLVAAVFMSSTVVAAPFFAQTTATVEIDGNTQPWSGLLIDGSLPYAASAPSSSAISNPGGTFNGASGSAWASSDLSTGELKAYATATQDSYTTFGGSAYSSATAQFGDSFTTTAQDGSPFVWGAGDTGRFNLDLSGVFSSSFNNPSDINYGVPAANHLVWGVTMDIYQSGTFASNFGQGGPVGQCTWSGFLDGSTSNSCSIPLLTNALSGNLSNGVSLTADLKTGGDFDWSLSMQALVYMMAPGSLTVDLGHTLNVGYTGPAGAVTTSASGLFPFADNGNPTPVPAPGMASLIGLMMLVMYRMRRSSRRSMNTQPLHRFIALPGDRQG